MKKTYKVLIVIMLVLSGCSGKDKVKPSADSLLTTEAVNRTYSIKKAYQEKNRQDLYGMLASSVADKAIEGLAFDSAELSFHIRKATIRETSITINLNWHGKWTVQKTVMTDRGITQFIFDGTPLRLVRIRGDNPFAVPAGLY